MGDPRKLKNKYNTPIHPWEKLRLEAERPLMREYGLVNKKELWKVSSKLKNFKDTAKKLVASKTVQASAEKKQMVGRMKSYGLISGEELDEILGLEVQQLLDRRLQTVVYKKGLARTVKQARQMITHRHIAVNGIKITAPSYLVKVSEQETIEFVPGSNFVSDDHPERALADATEVQKEKVAEAKKVESKEESKKESLEKKAPDKEITKEESKKESKEEKPSEKKVEKETKKSESDSSDKKDSDKKADE